MLPAYLDQLLYMAEHSKKNNNDTEKHTLTRSTTNRSPFSCMTSSSPVRSQPSLVNVSAVLIVRGVSTFPKLQVIMERRIRCDTHAAAFR